jgi:hypothetical protein
VKENDGGESMKRRFFIALLMLVLSWSVPALAVPFLYDESVSGDLTCQNPPCATTFPFDIGTNIIKGTVSNGAANTDSFSFSIPAGAVLTSVTYSWTVSGIPTVTVADTGYALTPNTSSFAGTESINLVTDTSPKSLFDSKLPLGAGTDALFQTNLGGTGGEVWTAVYEIDLQVDPVREVPEPPTLLPLAVGVAALAVFRKAATRNRAR